MGLGQLFPKVLDGFLGNVESRHPGAAAQQVVGHLTGPAHRIEDPQPPQADPRHHRLVEEPQPIRHAARIRIVALVFLFELILVSALLLLGRMLMRRLLVAGTHVPTESALVVQGRPLLSPEGFDEWGPAEGCGYRNVKRTAACAPQAITSDAAAIVVTRPENPHDSQCRGARDTPGPSSEERPPGSR